MPSENKQIKFRFSDEELEAVEMVCHPMSVSAYCKRAALRVAAEDAVLREGDPRPEREEFASGDAWQRYMRAWKARNGRT